MTTSPETLASCPFCGDARPKVFYVSAFWGAVSDDKECAAMHCENCGACGPHVSAPPDDKSKAIAAWNSRESSSRWRSVEEEMPEADVCVLVVARGGTVGTVVAVLVADHGPDGPREWYAMPDWRLLNVTHWMSLPAGPGEEE